MEVYKFGGASVKDAEAIKNVARIIADHGPEQLVVVVSAMGKTTNAMERVIAAYCKENGEAQAAFDVVKASHLATCEALFGADTSQQVYEDLREVFDQVESRLLLPPKAAYNFIYDQIVCAGELLSTILVAAYLNKEGVYTHWQDVRRCILTDNTYREGKVNWEVTNARVRKVLRPHLKAGARVVTQGFLGGTVEAFTTTLGREGSDYTAAILANCLDAECMSVWKDVPGILNGDPRLVEDAELLHQLSYHEAIEMTYYGAKVIHPKTIKPLHNKQIPLRVRSFKHPSEEGTRIHESSQTEFPPVVVFNKNQVLIRITTPDLSYVMEDTLSDIYQALAKYNIKTNLSQNGSVSFRVCVDDVAYKIEPLVEDLSEEYELELTRGIELITIRHYSDDAVDRFTKDKEILLTQKGKKNILMVVR